MDQLKMQLTALQDKLAESQRQEQASMQQASQAQNPFATTKNKYFDNFAKSKADDLPVGATQSLNTPNYGVQSGSAIQGGRSQAKTQLPLAQSKGPKAELERLRQERAELVATGCYTDDDPLI
jgi:hypothetical protein